MYNNDNNKKFEKKVTDCLASFHLVFKNGSKTD